MKIRCELCGEELDLEKGQSDISIICPNDCILLPINLKTLADITIIE